MFINEFNILILNNKESLFVGKIVFFRVELKVINVESNNRRYYI